MWTFLVLKIKRVAWSRPGSNWGPSACKADVITTTPQDRLWELPRLSRSQPKELTQSNASYMLLYLTAAWLPAAQLQSFYMPSRHHETGQQYFQMWHPLYQCKSMAPNVCLVPVLFFTDWTFTWWSIIKHVNLPTPAQNKVPISSSLYSTLWHGDQWPRLDTNSGHRPSLRH